MSSHCHCNIDLQPLLSTNQNIIAKYHIWESQWKQNILIAVFKIINVKFEFVLFLLMAFLSDPISCFKEAISSFRSWFRETYLTSLVFRTNFSLGSLVFLNCIISVYINSIIFKLLMVLIFDAVNYWVFVSRFWVLVFTFWRQLWFLYNTAFLWDDIAGKLIHRS